MTNRKVLITSGTGFIGANLAKQLAVNNSFITIDNLPAGKNENIKDLSGETLNSSRGQ